MTDDLAAEVRETLRSVPDFPHPGILFRDITPLLTASGLFPRVVAWLAEQCTQHQADRIACIESRGFLFGAPLAERLDLPLALIRKPGKLPHRTIRQEYALEYGSDALEMPRRRLRSRRPGGADRRRAGHRRHRQRGLRADRKAGRRGGGRAVRTRTQRTGRPHAPAQPPLPKPDGSVDSRSRRPVGPQAAPWATFRRAPSRRSSWAGWRLPGRRPAPPSRRRSRPDRAR